MQLFVLRSLSLILTTFNKIGEMTKGYPNYVGGFIRSLPSLITLKIVNDVRRDDFETAMRYHGASLRKLCLSPFGRLNQISITPQEIAQIRESCPQLENLSLTIPRSRGDAEEVAVYRALGTLSEVQKLSLTLDAFESSAALTDDIDDEHEFDEFDRKLSKYVFPPSFSLLPNGHFRLAFINRALDEDLARAIYQCISSTKKGGALPLRKLKLSMTGHGVITALGSYTIWDVFEQIGRSWLLVRHPRDDRPDELLVQEIRGQGREGMPIAKDLEVIFRKIWPKSRKEGGDWRDDWHSLPLAQV